MPYVDYPDARRSSCRRSCSARSPPASGSPRTCRRASSTGSARCRWPARRCSWAARSADLVRNVFVRAADGGRRVPRGLADPHRTSRAASARSLIVLAFAYSLSWVFAIVGLTHRTRRPRRPRRSRSSRCWCSRRRRSCPLSSMPGWLQAVRGAPAGVGGDQRGARRSPSAARRSTLRPQGDRVDRRHRRGVRAARRAPVSPRHLIAGDRSIGRPFAESVNLLK